MRVIADYILAVTFAIVWILSYSFYNSLGVDITRSTSNVTRTTHYRLRLPGNGSLWIGKISREYISADNTTTEFDLGGAFFQPPTFPTIQSTWQWLGFWWINERESTSAHPDELGLLHVQEQWVGVPIWLFLFVGLISQMFKRKK